jgi:alpha-beta hydrolase superfamily lysophospholipase
MDGIETVSGGIVIRFLAKDNVRLSGLLFPGHGRGKGCVIYVHGMGGSMINGISLALARNLGDLALFSFNNRGHDVVSSAWRLTGRKRRRVLAGLNFERFEESVHDLSGAIGALSRLGYSRFVLCGHSTGCQKAIYYQHKRQDRRIFAIVLLGPCDDYNLNRRRLGRRYGKVLAECKRLINSGRGNVVPDSAAGLSAQRLDSVIDLDRAEARLFNYDGELKEFGSITTPVLAVFGSEEENKLMPVKRYLEILDVKSGSCRFRGLEIKGANHSFEGKEDELSEEVYGWISGL